MMTKREFKIPSQQPIVQKTIRFPEDLVEEIEGIIRGKNCSFTAFVVEAVRVVVEELKEQGY